VKEVNEVKAVPRRLGLSRVRASHIIPAGPSAQEEAGTDDRGQVSVQGEVRGAGRVKEVKGVKGPPGKSRMPPDLSASPPVPATTAPFLSSPFGPSNFLGYYEFHFSALKTFLAFLSFTFQPKKLF
jgi:hypothetical protein